jgi:hypothetical protein
VGEIHNRVVAVGEHHHRHRAAPRPNRGVVWDPPGEDHPVGWLHRDVAAVGGSGPEIDGEPASRPGVEINAFADPADH